MIDMPSVVSAAPNAELGFTTSHFKNQTRNSLTFQISDRLSASFRYSALKNIQPNPGSAIFSEIYDRSFSIQYRFVDEGRYRPAFAIGLNDVVGTGIYAGEYVVASKTLFLGCGLRWEWVGADWDLMKGSPILLQAFLGTDLRRVQMDLM